MQNRLKKEIIPLYSRVAAIIENKIVTGQYEPGDKLPTEDDLVQYFNVSKITVRNALSLLEADRLITRTRGKGTFVAQAAPTAKQQYIYTDLNSLDQALKKSDTKPLELMTISVRDSRIPRDIRSFFKVSSEAKISRIRRIVTKQGVPYFYENYMSEEMAAHITKTDILKKKSIQAILQEKIGLKVAKGEMYLQAVPAEPDIADLLACQSFDPLIHIQTYFWLEREEPFEIVNTFFSASYFKYKIEMDTQRF